MNRHPVTREAVRIRSQKELLTVLFRHKAKMLAVFAAVVLTVVVGTIFTADLFEAKSTLMVKIGREYLNRPEVGDKQSVMALNQEEVLNSEIQILTNRELLRKVVDTITPEVLYPALAKQSPTSSSPLDRAIAAFEKDLTVEGVKKSNVIQVTFRHQDPQLAAKAVNLLVDYFREKHLQVFSEPQSSFLEGQLGAYARKLSDTESSIETYKQKRGVYSLAEQRSLLLQQRNALDSSLKSTEYTLSEMQKKIALLKDRLRAIVDHDGTYTQTERDKIIVDGKARLLALELTEQELLKKYTENNLLVINARKDIALVKNFLSEQEEELRKKTKNANPVYQDIKKDLVRAEADASGLGSRSAVIVNQIRTIDNEIRSMDLAEKNLEQLKRQKEINEKNYQTYAERTEEARISEAMNRLKLANISVIEAASIPYEPVMPKKGLNLALALFLGAGLAVGIAFLSEYLLQDFATPEKVENLLGVPVLASIPYKED